MHSVLYSINLLLLIEQYIITAIDSSIFKKNIMDLVNFKVVSLLLTHHQYINSYCHVKVAAFLFPSIHWSQTNTNTDIFIIIVTDLSHGIF